MAPFVEISSFIRISTYFLFGIAAASAGLLVTFVQLRDSTLSGNQKCCFLLSIGLGFIVGARIFNILINMPSPEVLLNKVVQFEWQNFSMLGGISGSALSGWWWSVSNNKNPWQLGDLTVPGIAVAVFFSKLGCFLNGCCFGKPTSYPLAVSYPPGSFPDIWHLSQYVTNGDIWNFVPADDIRYHPVQLYEAFGAILCWALVAILPTTNYPKGTKFLVFLIALLSIRLFIWPLRIMPLGLSASPYFYPALYVTGIVLSITLLVVKTRHELH